MKQVIVGENREAGAQTNKGREPDKGVRRERLGVRSSKMAGSQRNYLAIPVLNFLGIKKGVKRGSHKKGRRLGKQSMAPPPTHTH